MNTLDEQLEQSGAALHAAFNQVATPDSTLVRRRHRRQRTGAAGAFAAVALLAGLAIFGLIATDDGVGPASGGGDLVSYGLDLGSPWIPGDINHNDGAYDKDYWEIYHYLPTGDGEASAVVVRVTTRRTDDEESAARSVSALGAQDAIETSVAGRQMGAVVDDGNYSFAWIDGDVLVDVVVIQMAPGAVTRELAETAVSNVRPLTVDERRALVGDQTIIPSGPETTLEN